MEKKYKKLLNEKSILFILITVIFFGTFSKLEYATDTYCVFATPIKQYCEHFLYSGRFVSAFCLAISGLLDFSPTTIYTVSYILALISTIISMSVLQEIFAKNIKNKAISILISILIVINIFSIELYLFLEKGIMMLSVLFCILAFKHFVKYLEGNTKSVIITFIYMTLANFAYQGTVGIFIGLAVVYIAKKDNTIIKFIKDNIVAAFCYGIPALINYLIIKIGFHNSRISGDINILKSTKLIVSNSLEMLKNTYNILPKYSFIIILCIIIIIAIIVIITKKEKTNKPILLLKLFYIILGIYVATIFPQIMQSTSSIGFAPRNTYAFASIVGLILLYVFSIKDEEKQNIEPILIIISVILLIMQYIGFNNIIRNRYILNYNDYYNAMQIVKKVEQYETDTQKTINKVAIYKTKGNSLSYPTLYVSGDINIKATCPDWSRIDYLEYYLGRTLQEVETLNEVYTSYFENEDWTIFDTDQVILIDDTLHLCLY